MDWADLSIRVILSAVVGLGFVTPLALAGLLMAGFDQPAAMLGASVIGFAVFVALVPTMRRVEREPTGR